MIDVKEQTIFDHLNNVFVMKSADKVAETDSFPFYMIQRWGSMHSTKMALLLNEYVNNHYKALVDSKMEYDYIKTVVPRLKSSKFRYIKKKEKTKVEKKKGTFTKEDVSLLCKVLSLSKRDISEIIMNSPDELEKILNNTEVLKGKKIK